MTSTAIGTAQRVDPSERQFGAATVLWNLALIAALFFVNKLGVAGNAVFFSALLLMTVKSSEYTVRAFSLLYLVIVGNIALVNTGSMVFSAGKFLFLFVVAGRLLYSIWRQGRKPYRIAVLGPLVLFCLVALMLALEGGYFAHISALKLLSFMIGVLCVFTAAEAMRQRRHALDVWFLSIVVFIILIGLLTWALGLGFNAKTDHAYSHGLFNGPLYHPQTLGPASALIVLWLIGFGSLTQYRLRAWVLPMIAVFLTFIYMSSSRTSLIAIGLSILAALVALAFMRGDALRQMMRLIGRILFASIALAATLTVVELARPGAVVDPVLNFVIKSNSADAQLRAEVIMSSRQSLTKMMFENIAQDPWTGIGFGTSTHTSFVKNASLLQATTEKGILPIAIVEETGYIGAFFFVVFLLSTFTYLIRSNNIVGLISFAALLGINMAEMNFFSFGGHGGFFWMWVMAGMLMMPATQSRAPERPPRPEVKLA